MFRLTYLWRIKIRKVRQIVFKNNKFQYKAKYKSDKIIKYNHSAPIWAEGFIFRRQIECGREGIDRKLYKGPDSDSSSSSSSLQF